MFAGVAASVMKCKSLQNSARQQNTLGCQRGMLFSHRKIKILAAVEIYFAARFKSGPASDLPSKSFT
jgi:hypothetical protein